MREKEGAGELRISMQSIHYPSQQEPDIWATETMEAQGDGIKDWSHSPLTFHVSLS